MSKLANFVGFQICWFACVLGAARQREWTGLAVTLVWLALHVRACERPRREVLGLLAVAALGTAVDTLELQAGWLSYAGTPIAGALAPAWIIALWFAFATTFESSLRWVTRRWWLAAAFGAVGAPLSYWSGERLGAVAFGEPRWTAIGGIALAWGAAMPLGSWLMARSHAR